jgi:hypothetical protein
MSKIQGKLKISRQTFKIIKSEKKKRKTLNEN